MQGITKILMPHLACASANLGFSFSMVKKAANTKFSYQIMFVCEMVEIFYDVPPNLLKCLQRCWNSVLMHVHVFWCWEEKAPFWTLWATVTEMVSPFVSINKEQQVLEKSHVTWVLNLLKRMLVSLLSWWGINFTQAMWEALNLSLQEAEVFMIIKCQWNIFICKYYLN